MVWASIKMKTEERLMVAKQRKTKYRELVRMRCPVFLVEHGLLGRQYMFSTV